jgi:hypothetical protein
MNQQTPLTEDVFDPAYSDYDWNPEKYDQERPEYKYDFRELSIRDVVTDLTQLSPINDGLDICPICNGTSCFRFVPTIEYFICYNCNNQGHVQRFVSAHKKITVRSAVSFLIATYFEPQQRPVVVAPIRQKSGDDAYLCSNNKPQKEECMKIPDNLLTDKEKEEMQYDLF